MPDLWLTAWDETTGDYTLSNGMSGNLNDIPGNGWPAARLRKAIERIQELFDIDTGLQSDLPLDDPERSWTAAQFDAAYGGRRFLDSNDHIIERRVIFSMTWDGSKLIPTISRV